MRLLQTRYRLAALLVVGAIAVSLAGCSEPDRDVSITGEISTPTPTPTATPSPTPGLPSPDKLRAERLASEREWLAQTDYVEKIGFWETTFDSAAAKAGLSQAAARTELAALADARADEVQALIYQVDGWRALAEQGYEAGWTAGYCTAFGLIERVEPELADAISVTVPEGC